MAAPPGMGLYEFELQSCANAASSYTRLKIANPFPELADVLAEVDVPSQLLSLFPRPPLRASHKGGKDKGKEKDKERDKTKRKKEKNKENTFSLADVEVSVHEERGKYVVALRHGTQSKLLLVVADSATKDALVDCLARGFHAPERLARALPEWQCDFCKDDYDDDHDTADDDDYDDEDSEELLKKAKKAKDKEKKDKEKEVKAAKPKKEKSVPRAVLQTPLLDLRGNAHELGEIVGDELTVLVLLRHFACPMCWKMVDTLMQNMHRLHWLGLHVVCVGSGTPGAAAEFKRRIAFEGALYVDPKRVLYKALLVHKGLGRVLKGVPTNSAVAFDYRERAAYSKEMGSFVYMGACFVLSARDGFAFAYRSPHLGALPNINTLMEQISRYCLAHPARTWWTPSDAELAALWHVYRAPRDARPRLFAYDAVHAAQFFCELGERTRLLRNHAAERPVALTEGAPYLQYFFGERHAFAVSRGAADSKPLVVVWKRSGRALLFTQFGTVRHRFPESLELPEDAPETDAHVNALLDSLTRSRFNLPAAAFDFTWRENVVLPPLKLRHLAQALSFCEALTTHALTLLAFAAHAQRRLFIESLEFFLLAEKFTALDSAAARAKEARRIVERYIHTDAERAINIEGHVQRRVLDALAKLNATEGAAETDEADEECVPRLMFLEAQMAVAGLMASEPWEEFCAETDLDELRRAKVPKTKELHVKLMAIFGDAAVVDAALWLLQREQRGTPLTSSSSELTKASSGLTSSANRIHIGSKRAERDATRHGSSAELTPSPHWQQRHVLLAQIQRPLSQRLLDLEQTWQQDRCAAALYLASGLTEFDSIAAASEALDLATDPLALSFVKFSGAVTSRETRILTLRVLASSEDDANLSSRSDDDVDYREVELQLPVANAQDNALRQKLQVAIIVKESAAPINLSSFSHAAHLVFVVLNKTASGFECEIAYKHEALVPPPPFFARGEPITLDWFGAKVANLERSVRRKFPFLESDQPSYREAQLREIVAFEKDPKFV